MDKFELPPNLLNQLKCELCSEYLSYPPITLHADTGSVCGRCPVLEAERDITPLRESNYEKLAKNLVLFPCRFRPQGCQDVLPMDRVPEHETLCKFKPFFCPILPLGTCPWQGMAEECHMHFATEHQDNLVENNMFEPNLVENYQINLLFPKNDTLFMIHHEFCAEEGFFYCGMQQIIAVEGKKFTYCIKFNSGIDDKKFQSDFRTVEMFTENMTRDHGLKFNVVIIQESLNYPTMVTCSIELIEIDANESYPVIESEEAFIPEIEEELQQIIKIEDDKMLLDIECPVCQEFMVPPIFQCQTGHSVCGGCKPQLRECPSCRGPLGETRNFTLEKITEHIMYQCRNRYEGCAHRANSKNIKRHEEECKFSPVKCPFHDNTQCQWKGAHKAVISHVKIDHVDTFITEPLFITSLYVVEETADQQCITQAFGEIFRVRLAYNNEKRKVYGTVQLVGPTDEAKKFMYEVNVTDLKNKGLMLMSKKYCGSVYDKRNDAAHCSVWPLEVVLPLMSEDKHIHMKYKITRARV